MQIVEFHTKGYAKTKSKDPEKDGKLIGLETRLIIHPAKGERKAKEILDFDFQKQANEYLLERFGELQDGNYEMANLYRMYGERGYQW